MTRLSLGASLLLLSLAATGAASAAESPDPKAGDALSSSGENDVDPASPRAAVHSYLDLARRGENERALAYLDLSRDAKPRGAVLAERLRFVLERYGGAELDALSPDPEGDPDDGLRRGVDRVTVVTSASGRTEDLLIRRVPTRDGKRWLFAGQSVRRIDAWYFALREHRWLEALSAPLRRSGPLDLLWWQWGAVLLLTAIGWLVGTLLGNVPQPKTPIRSTDRRSSPCSQGRLTESNADYPACGTFEPRWIARTVSSVSA
ncbi:MAG TPA: hypothetical protein VKY73_02485 [Polyangiaceae bacterium]|nr:hypothetical protein [Polyangiaceae bacterium]